MATMSRIVSLRMVGSLQVCTAMPGHAWYWLGQVVESHQMGEGRSMKHQWTHKNVCGQSVVTINKLMARSDFKSETNFGFHSPNYTGHVTWFFWQNLKIATSRRVGGVFQGFLGTKLALWAQIIFLEIRKQARSVNLVGWILLSKKLTNDVSYCK